MGKKTIKHFSIPFRKDTPREINWQQKGRITYSSIDGRSSAETGGGKESRKNERREMPVAGFKLMQEHCTFVFLQRVTLISFHLSAPAFKNSHRRFATLKIHVHLILPEML